MQIDVERRRQRNVLRCEVHHGFKTRKIFHLLRRRKILRGNQVQSEGLLTIPMMRKKTLIQRILQSLRRKFGYILTFLILKLLIDRSDRPEPAIAGAKKPVVT